MTTPALLRQCLELIPAGGCCDDCLARKAGIRARAQVSQACRALAEAGRIVRKRGKCTLGDHTKLINTPAAPQARPAARRARPGAAASATASAIPAADLSIEDTWRWIDRFCRAMWTQQVGPDVPQSLADAITMLRDQELLPVHEANMMHTIRSLRNLVVHENLRFGEHETAIARAAWAIVRQWAELSHRDAWHHAATQCRMTA